MTNAPTGLAVITGAARRIGRASALALARRGFDTALVDLLEDELDESCRRGNWPARDVNRIRCFSLR
jgi:NAD(P)-dependent dehydrogenase (short-subunit alcohol dehydrogenase family)